jgi:hypothetical protein
VKYSISDINELNLPKTCNTEFPDADDLLTFKLIICPDEVRNSHKIYCNLTIDYFEEDSQISEGFYMNVHSVQYYILGSWFSCKEFADI